MRPKSGVNGRCLSRTTSPRATSSAACGPRTATVATAPRPAGVRIEAYVGDDGMVHRLICGPPLLRSQRLDPIFQQLDVFVVELAAGGHLLVFDLVADGLEQQALLDVPLFHGGAAVPPFENV